MDTETTKYVELLWTAGLDSTFRLVELSRIAGVEVQPYYIKGDRKSTSTEIEHMAQILEVLKQKSETLATIHNPIIIEKSSLTFDPEVLNAHTEFSKHTWIGSQYRYLASFARAHKGLELSIEKTDADECLHMKTKKITTDIGDTFVIDESGDKDAYIIFRDFSFPVIDKTKDDEYALLHEWGYDDVVALTWFCHNPIKGKPCGYCHPCCDCVEMGFKFRLDKVAMRRYHLRFFYRIPLEINNILFKRKNKKLQKQFLNSNSNKLQPQN